MPEAVTVGSFVIDPNIVYVLLVFGLWTFVTALYVPGTGVVEVLAGLALLGAVLMLAVIPTTNWWAVILLIVGVFGFMILPFFKDKRLERLALAGLGLQALGAVFLFNGQLIHPLLIGLTVLVPLAYHLYILTPILEQLRKLDAQQEEAALIGASGRVVQPLSGPGKPTGTVQVRGELWTAQSDDPLETGTPIVVVEVEGVTLLVEAVKEKRREPEDMEQVGELN